VASDPTSAVRPARTVSQTRHRRMLAVSVIVSRTPPPRQGSIAVEMLPTAVCRFADNRRAADYGRLPRRWGAPVEDHRPSHVLDPTAIDPYLWEDGAKLVGIVSGTTYFWRTAAGAVAVAHRPDRAAAGRQAASVLPRSSRSRAPSPGSETDALSPCPCTARPCRTLLPEQDESA
jgi:hypothetical protein